MGEKIQFGDVDALKRRDNATPMFPDGDDLPLFSGTPMSVVEQPFIPQGSALKQAMLPDMPPVDYEHVLQKDKARKRRTRPVEPNSGGLLVDTETNV